MNKKMIDEIRAEMAEIKAPGACKCCPITIYNHLFPNSDLKIEYKGYFD